MLRSTTTHACTRRVPTRRVAKKGPQRIWKGKKRGNGNGKNK